MPGRSGYDLCASIKADPALRAVPVLILASSQQPYDDARGQKAGADGQLAKPWDTTAMMDKVRDAAAARGAPAPPAAGVPAARRRRRHRSAASLPTAAIDDDEYGEISIDTGRDSVPTIPRVRTATPAPAAPSPGAHQQPIHAGRADAPGRRTVAAAAAGRTSPGMRPSLIPGMRPGAMPPARPGTVPARPTAAPAAHDRAAASGGPADRADADGRAGRQHSDSGRHAPEHAEHADRCRPARRWRRPRRRRRGSRRDRPRRWTRARASPRRRRASASSRRRRPRRRAVPAAAKPALGTPGLARQPSRRRSSRSWRRSSAKGPEYEAIAKLSREIIEQVVWEVVPELAEAIIREHVKNKGI